jgi:hypothetical protein
MYYNKYLKYKNKYLKTKLNNIGGGDAIEQTYVKDTYTSDVLKYTFMQLVDSERTNYDDNLDIAVQYIRNQKQLHDYVATARQQHSHIDADFDKLTTSISFSQFKQYIIAKNHEINEIKNNLKDMQIILTNRQTYPNLYCVNINRTCNDTVMSLLCTYDDDNHNFFILCIVPSLVYAAQIQYAQSVGAKQHTSQTYKNLFFRIYIFTMHVCYSIDDGATIFSILRNIDHSSTLLYESPIYTVLKGDRVSSTVKTNKDYITNINNQSYTLRNIQFINEHGEEFQYNQNILETGRID